MPSWNRPSAPFLALATLLALGLARTPSAVAQTAFPPDEPGAVARLDASPRHGEWVDLDAGNGDRVRAWVVYPERSDTAPVVVVIHEIYGLSDWIRAVADQLAADGFIAIAPDLLSGKAPGGGGSERLDQQATVAAIRGLPRDEVQRRLIATARYGMSLPAALPRVATVGYCWGGSTSFALATAWPDLHAAVVYYGSSPADSLLAAIRAPVLGLYAGDDARVNATVPPAQAAMQRLGRRYEVEMYDGAGHGFLRQQAGRDGANRRATERAWPRMVAFLRETLGR
jgi:carboxymethylenebutenolidase